jgi:oxepin-CoA hydrolase/3-oxo-5,6-dehydrosuberyl-CoA semialdehyde dehydrogenase
MRQIPFDVNDEKTRRYFLNHTLREVIKELTEQSRPLWGRMTAQQMVEHLTWSFELSNGKIKITCSLPQDQLEKRKKFLYNDRPTPREVPNPELVNGLPPDQFTNLEDTRRRFGEELVAFLKYSAVYPSAIHEHPIFGNLNMEEWERAHYKHAFHHMLQFGLIPDAEPPVRIE